MSTIVLEVDLAAPAPEVLERFAAVLRSGGVAIFPTDTVYGIGGDGRRKEVIRRICQIKGRPEDKPLVRLISSPGAVSEWLTRLEDRHLAERFWPGPLTLILLLPGGLRRGFRCPDQQLIRELIKRSGIELAATSANLSGQPEVVSGEEARQIFSGKVDLILDGGMISGRPSTVLDLSVFPEKILRSGPVTRSEIEECLGYAID